MITFDMYMRVCAQTYHDNLILKEKYRMNNFKILSFQPGIAATMCIISYGMIYEGVF